MDPRLHIWNGWDLPAVVWLFLGIGTLVFVPSAITNYAGHERTVLLLGLLCTGTLFVLAGFGRRIRHIQHLHNDPRPFDAPD
ncbi:hypothetical protein [Smaragdicoccus niigatensis]|uniref:hypothetical protein n=1 Tax=Smaragdicoccus niigatensis TaxID=359359 RepID=UPI00035EECFC|nr:hypothetical protein [Smaragdicoccus niigatensis]